MEVQYFTFQNRLAYSKCKSFKSWLSSDHRVLIKTAICYLQEEHKRMYLGREKDLRKKPLKDAEKKAGLRNPGEGRCLIHCLWLLRWPKGSVTEHRHRTQFLCLGFDYLWQKIVGELWVRKGLQQRAVFTLAWGLDWLACLQTPPIKDSLRSLNDNNHLNIKQTHNSLISVFLWGSLLPPDHKPTRYASARVCSKGKERMGSWRSPRATSEVFQLAVPTLPLPPSGHCQSIPASCFILWLLFINAAIKPKTSRWLKSRISPEVA